MNSRSSGYILILTLMMMGLAMGLVTRMFYQSSPYLPLSRLMQKRQQARLLALAGVELALSRLVGPAQSESETSREQTFKFLERVVPPLNRSETFKLNEIADGVDGEIQFCITCEDGKFNLNQWYDFTNHKFYGDQELPKGEAELTEAGTFAEKFLYDFWLKIEQLTKGRVNGSAAFRGLMSFLRERKGPLIDVTELLQISDLEYFRDHVFYRPLTNSEDVAQPEIYLTDLFTTWSSNPQLQIWFLSNGVLAVMGFPTAKADDIIGRKQLVAELLKKFKVSTYRLKMDQLFKELYQADLNSFPKIFWGIFDSGFMPKIFGVRAVGVVGQVQQTVYAIVQLQGGTERGGVVEKLYWL